MKTWFQALVGAGYCTVCLFALFDKRAEEKKRCSALWQDSLILILMSFRRDGSTLVIAGTRDLIKEKHTKTIAGAYPARSFVL